MLNLLKKKDQSDKLSLILDQLRKEAIADNTGLEQNILLNHTTQSNTGIME